MPFLDKLSDLVYDATLGLLKQYQEKTIGLAKIHAANTLVKAVRAVRRQSLLFVLLVLCLFVLAAGIVILPLALVFLSPWSAGLKAFLILLLGIFDIAIPAAVLSRVFSEKKWLKFTHAQELLDKATNG